MEYRKIRKMEQGSGFATFTPIVKTAPASRSSDDRHSNSDEKSPESSSVIDSKMIEQLYKSGGLVNDVNQLVSELVQIEQSSTNPFLSNINRGRTLQIAAKINEISQNKDYWKDAITRSKEAGGLGEVAVDTDGRVYTKTKDNKIQAISLADYSENRESTKLLSVQELLYERQYNKSLTGQNGVFTIADNAIGLNKITEHIKSLVSALGTDSTEDSGIYSKSKSQELAASFGGKQPTKEQAYSLSILNRVINSPSEYSQVKTKNSTERAHIEKALGYIWNTLGNPAQQKLRATAALNGVARPEQFILDILETNTDESRSIEVSPETTAKATGKDTTDDNSKKIALTPSELFHNDRLYQPGMTYEINNPKAKVSLRATATGIGPLYSLTKPGEVLEAAVVSSIFDKNNYSSILDKSKVFIGDTKIDPLLLSEVAFTGEDVGKVYLPVKSDGTPDLGQMERFNNAYQVFNINKDTWTTQQIQEYFRKAGFPGIQIKESKTSDGSITKVIGENGNVKPFLAVPIITNSASDLSNNPWMVEQVGNQKDSAKMVMNQAFSVLGGTPSKPKTINTSPWGYLSLETPYKGVMFVAYRPESSGILSSMYGHVSGKAPNETDIYRNLNYSVTGNNPIGIQGSAAVLK